MCTLYIWGYFSFISNNKCSELIKTAFANEFPLFMYDSFKQILTLITRYIVHKLYVRSFVSMPEI